MSDSASLAISITALIISTITALVGLILSWINHQKTFDPNLILERELNPITKKEEVCLKNIGNGTAHNIEITIYYKEKDELVKYRSAIIDSIEKGNVDFIHDNTFLSDNNIEVDVINLIEKNLFPVTKPKEGIVLDSKDVLITIIYYNEAYRKIRTHLLTYQFESFYKLKRSKFVLLRRRNS